jgi:hypothetical protein
MRLIKRYLKTIVFIRELVERFIGFGRVLKRFQWADSFHLWIPRIGPDLRRSILGLVLGMVTKHSAFPVSRVN